MYRIIAATIIGLGLAGPAFAYGTRVVEFDPAAELQRTTGSARYQGSVGGVTREARTSQGGSEAYPQPTRGVAHNGVDMVAGGSARYPVITPDTLNHPPTALSQDQVLTYDFDSGLPRPASVAGALSGEVGG